MNKLALLFIAALMFTACEKEERITPSQPKEVETKKKYNLWWIQMTDSCDFTGGQKKYKIFNSESERIDSTYKSGTCDPIKIQLALGDTVEGYWKFHMYAVENNRVTRGGL